MEKISLIIQQIVDYLASFGPLGGILLVMLESVLPILPLGVIVGLNMLSFGNFFGFILSYFSTIFGCMMSCILFRYVFKDKFNKWISKRNKVYINKWMKKLSNIKFTTLCLAFAIPATPAFAVNIAAGLSDIKLRKYLIALFIGKPAMLLFYGFIAVSVVESLSDPINLIKVLILVVITYIVSKIIEKVVKVEK